MSLNHLLHHRLYLHFFDRELGTSVDFVPSETLIREVMCCLLIASPAPLYCGLSPVWETSYQFGDIPKFVGQLEQSLHLTLLSNHETQAKFLAARREA